MGAETRELLRLNADPARRDGVGVSALEQAQFWCLDCKSFNRHCKACQAKAKEGDAEVHRRLLEMQGQLQAWRKARVEQDKAAKYIVSKISLLRVRASSESKGWHIRNRGGTTSGQVNRALGWVGWVTSFNKA